MKSLKSTVDQQLQTLEQNFEMTSTDIKQDVKQLAGAVMKMETKEVMVEFVVTQRAQLKKELMRIIEENKEES